MLKQAAAGDFAWQLQNTVRSTGGLQDYLTLSPEEKSSIDTVAAVYRLAVTPYYLGLMDRTDSTCPLRRQMIPDALELPSSGGCYDPLQEEQFAVAPHLIHRYPDRAVLLVTNGCFSYCRHCTRKRLMLHGEALYDTAAALAYIRRHSRIRDVLISGGDPLVLEDDQLEAVLAAVRSIGHVDIIRIGTRAPVVMPARISAALVTMIRKYHPVWINTQFNHPRELTPEALAACSLLVDAGIPLGNQSVLLKGVNDDTAVIRELMIGLVRNRIRPYYLYQCDRVRGAEHFVTPLRLGMEIIGSLRGHVSGLAVPLFVVDLPAGGGKIVLEPEKVVSRQGDRLTIRHEGKIYTL